MVLTLKKEINYPSKIKVIRKKSNYQKSWWSLALTQDKYYSSIINDKHYIYSFIDENIAEKCKKFIEHYKTINNRYPDLSNSIINDPSDNFDIYIEDEILELMKERCLINGIGLINIIDFNYTYSKTFLQSKNVFNLNIFAVNLLENEIYDQNRQIDNLNYLLDF